MNNQRLNSLAILVCGLALIASGIHAQNGPIKELRKELVRVERHLESRIGTDVDLDDVLRDLKRYVEVGSQLEDLNLLTYIEAGKLHDYRQLIELTDVNSEDHCNARIFYEIRAIKAEKGIFSRTILNYLNKFGLKQYTFCASLFRNNLIQAFGQLTGDQREDIDQLATEIVKDHGYDGRASIDTGRIALGTMYFLESNRGAKFTKHTTQSELQQHLDQLIHDFCNDVENKLRDPLSVYYEMISDRYENYNLDYVIHVWLVKDKICRSLRSDKENIINRLKFFALNRANKNKFFGIF